MTLILRQALQQNCCVNPVVPSLNFSTNAAFDLNATPTGVVLYFPGEDQTETEANVQTPTERDGSTAASAVAETPLSVGEETTAVATATDGIGAVMADNCEFSASQEKPVGESAASAAERSAEPEQTVDEPRATVATEATAATDDSISAAEVRTSSDVANAASAAAAEATPARDGALAVQPEVERQLAERAETGVSAHPVASAESERAPVDEEPVVAEQLGARYGARNDERGAETGGQEASSAEEEEENQAVDDGAVDAEERETLAEETKSPEIENRETPADEQHKPADEQQGPQAAGREIQTEDGAASSDRRRDVTADDSDASLAKQTSSLEEPVTSATERVASIEGQPTTLDEPPEAEITAAPAEEQADGGVKSDGEASIEHQTPNYNSENVAVDEARERTPGQLLSSNEDASNTRDDDGKNPISFRVKSKFRPYASRGYFNAVSELFAGQHFRMRSGFYSGCAVL
jgi:hypothetical protein